MQITVFTHATLFWGLTKAFVTVDHTILLNKVHYHFGIWGIAQQLIRSFLSNKMQYPKLYNCISQLANITFGVPQGSSLELLLFLMYVNGLPLVSQFQTTQSSDDTYLTTAENSLAKLKSKVNNELL